MSASPMDIDDDKKMSATARPGAFGASTVRRYHQFPIAGNVFEVDVRYTNLVPVGGGSYGLVCSADDSITQRRVAIKKVTNAFSDLTDAKRIMREIKLLGQLGDHENIIGLVDVMTMPPLTKKFNDIYIVCEVRSGWKMGQANQTMSPESRRQKQRFQRTRPIYLEKNGCSLFHLAVLSSSSKNPNNNNND